MLKPDGRLVITDWCDDYLACKVCDLFLRLFNRAHFHTYGQSQFNKMVTDAGFVEVRIDIFKFDWLWGFMTARGVKP